MKYQKGLISVVIPTYKRADTVLRAVQSVLTQTYSQIECIVVNDNDPDDEYSKSLYEKLSGIEDKRMKIINQPNHKNGAVARNYGIKESNGEFIAFLDDDDWWKCNKLEKQINQFNSLNEEYAVVSTLVEFYKDGRIIRKTIPYKTDNIMIKILERGVEITTSSILVKHECIDYAGAFDENLNRHQEIQFLAFITNNYKLSLLSEYLTCVGLEDMKNKPTVEQLVEIKKDFFNSVDVLVEKLSKREQRCIKGLHRLEILYRKIQNRYYLSAISDFFVVISSPSALVKGVKRIRKRIKERG